MNAETLISTYFQTGSLPDLPADHFIDGAFVAPVNGARMESFDPGRGRVFADLPVAMPRMWIVQLNQPCGASKYGVVALPPSVAVC